MFPARPLVALLLAGSVSLIPACGGSKAGAGRAEDPPSGAAGKYVSVANPELVIELKSGGALRLNAAGIGSSSGTWTAEGEKILLSWGGQQHTLILNGSCLEDPQSLFDKSCKGGKAGEAGNVATHTMPVPQGTWVATAAEGEFKLEFQPGNKVTLSATPPGGKAEIDEGTYLVEGDEIHATVHQEPMVLKYVNNAYETTSFGFLLRFVKTP